MKLITAIVNKEDSKNVCNELIKAKFYVTRLATTGGFLMAGNVTILIGVDEEKVQTVIDIIREHSHSRKQMIPTAMPIEVTVGGATIFVTNVERFEKL